MSDDPTFDRTARIWLEDGPGEAPDAVLQAALLAIETTPMERDLRIPWRFPPMIRASVAAVAVVAVVAVGGAAIWRNQSQPTLPVGGLTPTAVPSPVPSASPSPTAAPTVAPSPSALAVAIGNLVPGTRYEATQLSQPLTFLMPTGFAPTGASALADPWAGGHTFRVWGRPEWAVTIHDDVLLAKDLCDASSGLAELPQTPEAIGAWLAASSATTLSAPMQLQVDGRTATAWDATFGQKCHGQAQGAEFHMSAGDVHRFYAIPTGSDTILAVTWASDLTASDKLIESLTFP